MPLNEFNQPASYDLSDFKIVLLIFVILLIVTVLLLGKTKKLKTAKISMDELQMLDYCINQQIQKYNRNLNLHQMKSKELREKIEKYSDYHAMEEYNCTENDYDGHCKEVLTIFSKIESCTKNRRVTELRTLAEEFENGVDQLELDVDKLSQIKVEPPQKSSSYKDASNTARKEQTLQNKVNTSSQGMVDFFHGCKVKEDFDKRFRALAKVYHPDTNSGDSDTFLIIKQEYEKRKRSILS